MTKILSFQDDYRFLSNFEGPEVKFDGVWYPKVEHAYQAAKTLDKKLRIKFADPGISAGLAKKLGNPENMVLRGDWLDVRDAIMEILVRQKWLERYWLEKLLSTGEAHLEEGNYWHDQYWGNCGCRGHKDIPGENKLGLLHMKIRAEMQGFRKVFDQVALVF